MPVTTLNSVVLPEPFGPIRPTISPSFTAKSTPARATRPPKRQVTPLQASTAPVMAPDPPPEEPLQTASRRMAARSCFETPALRAPRHEDVRSAVWRRGYSRAIAAAAVPADGTVG